MAQSQEILELLDLLDEIGLDFEFLWGFVHDESLRGGGQLSPYCRHEDAKDVKEARNLLRTLVKSKEATVKRRKRRDDELIQKLLSVVNDGHLDETITRRQLQEVPGIVARWKKLCEIPVVIFPDEKVTEYLRQATSCYLYGLPSAAAALCRTVLEFSLQAKLGEPGGISSLIDKVDKKDHLKKLINFAQNTRMLSEDLAINANRIREVGRDAIHKGACTERQALETIKRMGEILSHLYYGRIGQRGW